MEHFDAWKVTGDLHLKQGKADPFSAAIRATRMPIVVTDPHQHDNPVIFANDAFLLLTGYTRSEVNGRNCRFLQGPDTDPAAIARIAEAIASGEDVSVEILNYRKNGETFWNGLYVSPVQDEFGAIQYFFASQLDITERKADESRAADMKQDLERLVRLRTKELEGALATSNLLLHELDHRVKNNLQMIGAMLTLQSDSIDDERVKDTLQDMLDRVEALGLVHKRLYKSTNLTDFDLADFTEEIAANLVAASGRRDIALHLETESVAVNSDSAASIALVINEAITNVLRNAFPADRPGALRVRVRPVDDICMIAIENDGIGMNGSLAKGGSFGWALIETLLQQLRATIEWGHPSAGTCVEIRLPLS